MSLVTLREKQQLLRLVGSRTTTRDRMLLSLATQSTWTQRQRDLAERLIHEAAERRVVEGRR